MECYYHPDKEGTNTCAICGKSVCGDCSLEIAGKVYCKECLEKIVGMSIQNAVPEESKPVEQEPLVTEAPAVSADNSIYQPQEETADFEIPYTPQEEVPSNEFEGISNDSPYNIKENIEYTGGLESSYTTDSEINQQPQVAQNELDIPKQTLTPRENTDFIYPDHTYEPPTTSARQELEDKYEKYLDDLYFDENEIPLVEQLEKDEAQYGSLTRKEYVPKPKEEPEPQEEVIEPEIPTPVMSKPKIETPEEMEARIRAEILKEQGLMTGDVSLKDEVESKKDKKRFSLRNKDKKENKDELITDIEDKNIHNINYKDEKEPMGVADILLTIVLVIVILVVLYYLVYLFLLSSTYPTFMDAVFALQNPQNVINSLLTQL